MLTLLHDSRLCRRLLLQKNPTALEQQSTDCVISHGATTIATETGSCGKPCGTIGFLDKSKYRRTPRMITEQSHFCGIKDSLIRLKVVLQGLLPVTESRLENT